MGPRKGWGSRMAASPGLGADSNRAFRGRRSMPERRPKRPARLERPRPSWARAVPPPARGEHSTGKVLQTGPCHAFYRIWTVPGADWFDRPHLEVLKFAPHLAEVIT